MVSAPDLAGARIANALRHSARNAVMIDDPRTRPRQVVGPLGESMTLDSLPPITTRWVIRRKAEVVAAVNGGLLSIEDVCKRCGLTLEELASWQRAVERSGMKGLRVTQCQQYRDSGKRQQNA